MSVALKCTKCSLNAYLGVHRHGKFYCGICLNPAVSHNYRAMYYKGFNNDQEVKQYFVNFYKKINDI